MTMSQSKPFPFSPSKCDFSGELAYLLKLSRGFPLSLGLSPTFSLVCLSLTPTDAILLFWLLLQVP